MKVNIKRSGQKATTLKMIDNSLPFEFISAIDLLGRIYIKIYSVGQQRGCEISVTPGFALVTNLEQGGIEAVREDTLVLLTDYEFNARSTRYNPSEVKKIQ